MVFINGDVGEEGIGLSDDDRDMLIDQVSIIFHSAAILKMDANLRSAINVNTMGTVRMLDMAQKMKKLQVFGNRMFENNGEEKFTPVINIFHFSRRLFIFLRRFVVVKISRLKKKFIRRSITLMI